MSIAGRDCEAGLAVVGKQQRRRGRSKAASGVLFREGNTRRVLRPAGARLVVVVVVVVLVDETGAQARGTRRPGRGSRGPEVRLLILL